MEELVQDQELGTPFAAAYEALGEVLPPGVQEEAPVNPIESVVPEDEEVEQPMSMDEAEEPPWGDEEVTGVSWVKNDSEGLAPNFPLHGGCPFGGQGGRR